MKMNVKMIVAALCAVGVLAPLQQAYADTITPPAITPPAANPGSPTVPTPSTVNYSVNVTLPGGTAQTVTFQYVTAANGTTSWVTPAGWTYFPSALGANYTTAEFRTTASGTSYGITLTANPAAAGQAASFSPAVGALTTAAPSVGATMNGTPVSTSLFGAATATGTVTGVGSVTAPLIAGTPTTLPVGATGVVVTPGATPVSVTPTGATPVPGSAGGTITVSSTATNNAIVYGQYVVTIPQTDTPPGTGTVAGTVAGSTGSFNSSGINISGVTGTASYNTLTGVTTTTTSLTPGFNVNGNGNTMIGCAGSNTG